jgi:molybdopterin-guanine dinucleotide biosynthesis protein A
MGENKALRSFRGNPLLRRQLDLLEPLFKELILGANDPAPYASFNVRVVPDLLAEPCALTGIHALLKAANQSRVFAVACDLPFLNPALVEKLLSLPDNYDAIVPESDRGLEPLHAVYSKSCIPAIEDAARRGSWKVSDFYPSIRVERLRIRDADWLMDGRSPFLNVNTPEDWRSAAP